MCETVRRRISEPRSGTETFLQEKPGSSSSSSSSAGASPDPLCLNLWTTDRRLDATVSSHTLFLRFGSFRGEALRLRNPCPGSPPSPWRQDHSGCMLQCRNVGTLSPRSPPESLHPLCSTVELSAVLKRVWRFLCSALQPSWSDQQVTGGGVRPAPPELLHQPARLNSGQNSARNASKTKSSAASIHHPSIHPSSILSSTHPPPSSHPPPPSLGCVTSLCRSVAAVKETPFSWHRRRSAACPFKARGGSRRHGRMQSMFGQLRSSRRGESLAPPWTNESRTGVTLETESIKGAVFGGSSASSASACGLTEPAPDQNRPYRHPSVGKPGSVVHTHTDTKQCFWSATTASCQSLRTPAAPGWTAWVRAPATARTRTWGPRLAKVSWSISCGRARCRGI